MFISKEFNDEVVQQAGLPEAGSWTTPVSTGREDVSQSRRRAKMGGLLTEPWLTRTAARRVEPNWKSENKGTGHGGQSAGALSGAEKTAIGSKGTNGEKSAHLGSTPSFSITSCATSGQLLHLSVPRFPHL